MSEIIFGKRSVFEALENDIQIDKVFMDKNNLHMDNIKRIIIEKKSVKFHDCFFGRCGGPGAMIGAIPAG